MLPLNNILCPIDLSPDSRSALQVAGEMAHYFNARLTVLHVCDAPPPPVWPAEGLYMMPQETAQDSEGIQNQRRQELQKVTRDVLPNLENLRLEVVTGDPAGKILEAAHRDNTDLVVIAPHGRGRLRRAIFGSTAEKVVKESPCPVVTMHAGQEIKAQSVGISSARKDVSRA